ncbi:MAG TPA: lipoyl(octanoyl) transferase LipB [Gemmatimonadales bacterium]|nr:lipoyl(octanoyl) transferase LipB [Gemmatimonadales bacterium]
MTRALRVIDLGRRPYGDALELQRELCRRRVAGAVDDDLLLLVEHDPVVTLGRGTRPESLPVPPDALRLRGVEVFEVERGGDVTVHEPGQLVGYPILDLQGHRPDLHWYLRELEGVLIDALATVGIAAGREPGRTGVWVEGRKVASIGIHVKQWVTFHGFALNVTNDLRGFDAIVPCGIPGVEMTSVAREVARIGGDPTALRDRMQHAVVEALGRRFDRTPVPDTLERTLGPALVSAAH